MIFANSNTSTTISVETIFEREKEKLSRAFDIPLTCKIIF